jgi:putative transposase
MTLPRAANQRWSLDFASDTLTDGRRLRILIVVDDFSRECLCLVADTSISGTRVCRELDAIAARRGKPLKCVSDNGTELTSTAVLRWCQERQVGWHYIASGKPQQNAFAESFIGSPTQGWAGRPPRPLGCRRAGCVNRDRGDISRCLPSHTT